MTRHLLLVLVLLSAASCLRTEDPDPVPTSTSCTDGPVCSDGANASFSLLRLRRSAGPDRDLASYRLILDEVTCTVEAPGIVCERADGAPARVFVSADVSAQGVGRLFRVDTLARPSSHLVVQRNGVTIDELDHQPTLTRPCERFAFDLGYEHVLASFVPLGWIPLDPPDG